MEMKAEMSLLVLHPGFFLSLKCFFLSLQRFLFGPEGFFLGLWEVQTVVNRRHSLAELEVDSDINAIAELLCRIRD